jgi:hypothetical protein
MSGGEYPHPEGGGCGELCILLMVVEMLDIYILFMTVDAVETMLDILFMMVEVVEVLDIYILFMTVDAVETMLAASHCLAARLPFPPVTSVNLTIRKD